MEGEIWRDVPGYEGLYMVSNMGNVLSLGGRKGSEPLKVLRQSLMTSGYKMVVLRKDGISKNVSVHRMVALAFIPNPSNKAEVNHKDGNKLNNTVPNLEWVSKSENALHAYRVLGKKHGNGHHSVKLTADKAREIYLSNAPTIDLARKYGVSDTMIRNIKNGKAWKEVTCL